MSKSSIVKEKRLAKNIVYWATQEDRYNTLRDLLLDSGYALSSAMANPGKVIAQKAVQDELVRLGFNANVAQARCSEILLNGKDSDSLKAAELIFRVLGSFAPEKHEVKGFFAEFIKELDNEQGTIIKESNS